MHARLLPCRAAASTSSKAATSAVGRMPCYRAGPHKCSRIKPLCVTAAASRTPQRSNAAVPDAGDTPTANQRGSKTAGGAGTTTSQRKRSTAALNGNSGSVAAAGAAPVGSGSGAGGRRSDVRSAARQQQQWPPPAGAAGNVSAAQLPELRASIAECTNWRQLAALHAEALKAQNGSAAVGAADIAAFLNRVSRVTPQYRCEAYSAVAAAGLISITRCGFFCYVLSTFAAGSLV